MAAGDFIASAMPDILVKQKEMFNDPRTNLDLSHPVESAKALFENQQVRFVPQMQDGTCVSVKAVFLKNTDTTVTDAGVTPETCEIAGAEGESDNVTYDPNIHVYREFTVSNAECNDKFTFEDKLAREFMRNKVLLEKEINERVISFMGSSATANQYTDTEGTIVGTVTNFEKSQWTEDLLGEFRLTADMNRITNPIMLTGTNFYKPRYAADFDALNMDEKDKLAKFSAWRPWYFDPLSLDTVLGTKSTFMFEPGAAGFWQKKEINSRTPISWGDKDNTVVWSEPSLTLNYKDGGQTRQVAYDVYSRTQCIAGNNGRLRYKTSFRFVFEGGLILAPSDGNGSGILQFDKVADTP